MATFVTTVKFTEQGIKDIKATVGRANAFKALAAKMDVQVKNLFWTHGCFDGVVILDAPDDESVTALMLHLSSFGNVQTQTCRAYDATDIEAIIGKMPE